MESEGDEEFYFLLLASVMIIVLATYFVFSSSLSLSTMWVVLNLGVGYVLLMDEKVRKRYVSIMKGFRDVRCWGYALLMVFLVFLSITALYILSPHDGSGGSSGGNPFVSDPLFLVVTIPLIPLFAYAETMLFQRYILKAIIGRYGYVCDNCGKKAIGTDRCDLCGYPVKEHIPEERRSLGIVVSASVFALAHVILTGSLLASLTFIGGYLMAYVYLKEGWLPVARIHAIYDYIIIGLMIGGSLI